MNIKFNKLHLLKNKSFVTLVVTVTFDQFNASLLNKSINFLKNFIRPSVTLNSFKS